MHFSVRPCLRGGLSPAQERASPSQPFGVLGKGALGSVSERLPQVRRAPPAKQREVRPPGCGGRGAGPPDVPGADAPGGRRSSSSAPSGGGFSSSVFSYFNIYYSNYSFKL